MNMSKTHTMTNSTKGNVEVDGQALHYVDEYIYLGQLVSFDNRQEKEIDRRIENAWKSYWSMKHYMKGDLPLSLKRKLVDMCILPVLTYGAQTWSLTECQKSSLKVCQRAMERSLLGIRRTDLVRNTDIRSKTGVADVGHIKVELGRTRQPYASGKMGHYCHPVDTPGWTPQAGRELIVQSETRKNYDKTVTHPRDDQALLINFYSILMGYGFD
ncbi:hypothetical protein B5X24_HaOG204513 [Helicoverpa armigera]|uniref:Reverse transcriptase domain-containing protein n=1 Tax=Helicoverpa armigera TaxID=29058 RepID=A0A2W1BXJ8_HELAM|nr:hypothetical protein B5X24_HaOG204513 [Helicoverpa armigera]